MKKFKLWLEDKEFDKNKDFIFSYLDLSEKEGLSMPLDGFDKKDLLKKLKASGFYDDLSEEAKDRMENVLLDNDKTIGDLVRAISEN
jgi:hypothetical protein